MRDFLSLTPKKPELVHADDSSDDKQKNELVQEFGSIILTQTVEQFLRSKPPAERKATHDRLLEVLLRQVDSAFDQFGHSVVPERDYLAFHKAEEGDAVQYGVLGMKWGRRRSDAALAAAETSRAKAGEPVTPTAKRSDGPESSHDRYARIAGVAKGGGAKGLSDDDLKFFNARTEAIKKVDKMFEEKPSWLRTTSDDVVRAVAKQQMQAVLSIVATKMISARVNEAMTQAQANAQKAAIKEGVKKGLDEALKKAEINQSKAKIPIGFGPPPKK